MREMQLTGEVYQDLYDILSFPAYARDATVRTANTALFWAFISRLCARCNLAILLHPFLHELSFPAYARDATALRRDAEIWGSIELFARTSFQSASQPQFSLDIVDV